ncbi:unnamed protein product [Pedinophyceae sp. YPF-701]|nr:unnamed protein product [Pedinophyceae sp. YPF-701]
MIPRSHHVPGPRASRSGRCWSVRWRLGLLMAVPVVFLFMTTSSLPELTGPHHGSHGRHGTHSHLHGKHKLSFGDGHVRAHGAKHRHSLRPVGDDVADQEPAGPDESDDGSHHGLIADIIASGEHILDEFLHHGPDGGGGGPSAAHHEARHRHGGDDFGGEDDDLDDVIDAGDIDFRVAAGAARGGGGHGDFDEYDASFVRGDARQAPAEDERRGASAVHVELVLDGEAKPAPRAATSGDWPPGTHVVLKLFYDCMSPASLMAVGGSTGACEIREHGQRKMRVPSASSVWAEFADWVTTQEEIPGAVFGAVALNARGKGVQNQLEKLRIDALPMLVAEAGGRVLVKQDLLVIFGTEPRNQRLEILKSWLRNLRPDGSVGG